MATASIPFDPKSANLFTTGIPELVAENGTNIPYSGYAFDASAIEQIFLWFPARFYLTGNLTVRLKWYSRTSQTTNAVVWGAQIAAVTPGDAQSVLTDSLATASTTTTTVNATAQGETMTDVIVSNLDSLAEGDDVQLRIFRDATNGADNMTGDAVLFGIEVLYTSVGAGNVNGPGASTDNAIVRWDGTAGAAIQDSVVTIADTTGNMAGVGTLNGRTIANWVDGPASVTDGRVMVFDGTTGKLAKQDSRLAADLVAGPASVTDGRVTAFDGATGKLIKQGTQLVVDLVSGPASSVAARVATFLNTTGKIIQDGGVLLADLVLGPAAATDNAIARFDATGGKLIQNSAVTIADTTGDINVAGGGTVTASRFIGFATGIREQSGPTDLTVQNIVTNQILKRSGTDLIGIDLLRYVDTADSAAITSTLTMVGDATLQGGGQTYIFEFWVMLAYGVANTSATVTVNLNYTAAVTRIAYESELIGPHASLSPVVARGVFGANNLSVSGAVATTTFATDRFAARIRGTITPGGAGQLQIRISRSGGTNTIICKAGSYRTFAET